MNDHGPEQWPVELRALCALLSPAPPPGLEKLLSQLDQTGWDLLSDLAIKRHRVAPVIASRLEALPVPVATCRKIKEEARRNAAATLSQMSELDKLVQSLRSIDVRPVILKGWPLAERLYGAAGNRQARDIDILVTPDEIPQAAKVLSDLGYHAAAVYTTRANLISSRALREECYDLEFVNTLSRTSVELHWRTSHFAGWPDMTGDRAMVRSQATSIGDLSVPTDQADLIYLAGHGAMHAWARLKWLVDISRLKAGMPPQQIAAALDVSREIGAWNVVALALRLSSKILGTDLPESLQTVPVAIQRLESRTLTTIAAPSARPGTLRYRLACNLASFHLAETRGQKLGVLRYAVWRRIRLGLAALGAKRRAV